MEILKKKKKEKKKNFYLLFADTFPGQKRKRIFFLNNHSYINI